MKLAHIPAHFKLKNERKDIKENHHFLFNITAFLIISFVAISISWGISEIVEPIENLHNEPINLDPLNLINYSGRTAFRMFVGIVLSIIFAFIYGSAAAYSKRGEQILIPLLDILQSVPILGYISFTITGFLLLFPGSVFGAECAAIFAIFTSQAWNLAFSFYQSVKTIPEDIKDVSIIFKISKWQKFWRIDIPFAIPGLVTNMMVSMSSGWFFVVAAEVINVGNNSIMLPGIGSYIFIALAEENVVAIFYALSAMAAIILLYDRLIIRTLIAWGDKFQYSDSANQTPPKSWILDLLRKSYIINKIQNILSYFMEFIAYFPKINNQNTKLNYGVKTIEKPDYIWHFIIIIFSAISSYYLAKFLYLNIGLNETINAFKLTFITMLRVVILVIIISIIWVPIGIIIGCNHKLAAIIEPITQFLAAFPANLLFPIAVMLITYYDINPNIWLSPLMIIGAQWYVLFNIIIGASSVPNELIEVTKMLNIKNITWWRKIMLPAIIPNFITGAITATGGAWNACIIAEIVNWGDKQIMAQGIGSYIAKATIEGNFNEIILGIGVMSFIITIINKFFWQPIYNYTIEKYRL